VEDEWRYELAGRFRFPLAVTAAIIVVLAVGIPPEPRGSIPVGAVPWPSRTPPSPTPAAPGCRASVDDPVSPGVEPTAIRIASTVTLDGPGAALLDQAPVGMRAIINKVNRSGGICGRRVELTTVNDSWDRDRGHTILRRFIEEDYFALVGLPASDGLVAALELGEIDAAGIPVVGTPGMADAEFGSSWVWPVGTSTSAMMRIVAEHASVRGAWRFAVVRDAVHQFAHDGVAALRAQVARRGGLMATEILIDPADSDLADEADKFELACGRFASRCDAVVLLLHPPTALAWRAANPHGTAGRARPGGLTYGAQTLFTDRFAGACARWCDGMVVWTAYHPSVAPLDDRAEIARFVGNIRAERTGADLRNQSVQQAYIGMTVFIEAARRCSPVLTRSCLRETLNSTMFTTGLAPPLRWHDRGRHANKWAQGYVIRASDGSFTHWEPLPGPSVRDPAG